MKIIDFEKKGNVVRFYIGINTLKDWGGDDWDDRPYEHNAGKVYDEYILGYIDIALPFDCIVLEPKDPERQNNSCWCKDDMKARKIPCIIIVPETEQEDLYEDDFMYYLGNEKVKKIYFGDNIQKVWDIAKEPSRKVVYER